MRLADGGGSVLVPMVADAVRRVAPEAGRIEVNLEFLDLPPAGPSGAGAPDPGDRGSGR